MSVYFQKSVGTYMYDFQYKKVRYTESGYPTKKEAAEAEADQKKWLKSQVNGHARTGMDFLDLVNYRLDWLEEHRSERHYNDTKYMAKRWVAEWGTLKVSEISLQHIETYLRAVRREISVATANKELRYLKSLFNYGVKPPRCWFANDPTRGIEFYRIEECTERYVPPIGDVLKVILAATQDQGDYLWTIALTLARKGEVDRLEWRYVDFKNNVVILHTRKSDGGNIRPRKVPMVPKLKAILESRRRRDTSEHPWVFWHRYYSRKQKTMVEGPYADRKSMMATLCTKVKVPYFRFHPLRHFGATMLERSGVPIRTIQTLLGHQNRSTTEIYLHSVGSEEISAMNNLEKEYENEGITELKKVSQ
jgi:integrase